MKNKPESRSAVSRSQSWHSEHKKAGYIKHLTAIGNNTLLAEVEAAHDITLDTIDTDLLNAAVLDSGLAGEKIFLIWDMKHVADMSYRYKRETASLIYNPENPFRAIVFFNVQPDFMTMVETFAAIIQESVPVLIVDSMPAAMEAIDAFRSGMLPQEHAADDPDEQYEQRKKEFLAVTGRLSWLNMLNQNITLPPPDDPYYSFFKAIENLQSDLSENIRREQIELEQIKKDCEKALTEKTIQLHAQEELYKQLKHQLEKEKASLTSRIASQEMELTRISTAIAEKTSTLQEILDIISSLDIEDEQKQEMIRTCENMIETEMIEKKLNIDLTSTDSDFLLKLQKKHPNLNQRELRICLLVKLNYDTKEIARSIGISTRGMESIRYRMHKKIGLDRHQSIKGYLTELATAS